MLNKFESFAKTTIKWSSIMYSYRQGGQVIATGWVLMTAFKLKSRRKSEWSDAAMEELAMWTKRQENQNEIGELTVDGTFKSKL